MKRHLPGACCARLLAATLSLAASLGLHAQTTTDDHGNTTSAATMVTLPSAKTGSLEKAGDVDYFKFTLAVPSVVTVTSGGTTDMVGTLWLGGAKGAATSIVTDNDSAGAPNFRVQQLLPAGTHYLNVFPAVHGTLGAYTVNFSVSEPSTAQPDVTLGFSAADLPAGTLVDFGTAAPGGTVTKDFSVGNAGDAPLTIYGVRLTLNGTLPAGASFPFRIITSPAPTVNAGRQTTFRIAFQSSVANTYTGKLAVVSNDGDEIFYEVPLRGISSGALPPPEIEIRDGAAVVASNGTINAGSTTVNTRLNKTITIANTGTGELKITGSSLVPVSTTTATGSNTTIPMAFSLYNSTIPTSIPAGGQATFQISLFHLVAGNYAARLTLSNNDGDENPTVINFTGTVSAGTVQGEIGLTVGGGNVATNSTLDHGSTVTGVGVTKDFMFTNSGTSTLNLTSWQLQMPPPVMVQAATTTTVGSTVATVANGTVLAPGMGVAGPFVAGTSITSVVGNTVTFSSPATAAINNAVLSYPVAGPNATVNAFRFDSSLPASLAAGATATLKVTYLPLQTGDHTVALKVYSNDADENPYTVTLTGHCDVNPNPGDIAVSLNGADVARDSTVDWGSLPAGMTALKNFTVTNTGTGELRLTSFSATPVQPLLSSTTPLYFYFGGTPSQVLPAGQSGSLVMIFKPAAADTVYRSTLVISSTDPDENPYRINLTGTGLGSTTPVADVDVAVNGGLVANNGSFAFGPVNSGTLVQKALTIYNSGNAPLMISSARVTQPVGTPAGTPQPFSVWITPPLPIAAGQSHGTWLNFAPTAAGTYNATVQLFSNDPDESPYTINVTGTAAGTVSAPEIVISHMGSDLPTQSGLVTFGQVAAGFTASRQFTITNTGDAPLTLSNWAFQQPAGTTTLMSTITTLGSNVGTVTNAGLLATGMTVGSPFPTGTTVVSITGNTVTFSAAASSTTATLVTYFQQGVPAANPFQFSGTLPTSVAAGASASFTINYTPQSAGSHAMIVRFSNNDISENPFQFTVTGSATGVAPAPEVAVAVDGVDVPVNSGVAYGGTYAGVPVSKQLQISNTGNAPLSLGGWSFVLPVSPAATATGTTTTGSNTVNVSSTSNLAAGMVVTGPFPTGTTIVGISGSTVTFSSPATSTQAAALLSFYPAGTSTANPFQFSGTPPTSVAAGATATVTVNYSPTAAGSHSINLRFTNNDSNENPFNITLTGSATLNAAAPEISVLIGTTTQPINSTLDFGTIARGTTATKDFIIKNTGTGNLTIGNIITAITPAASGGNTTPAFTWQIISGSSTVAPAGSTTVRVTFKPDALATSYSSTYNISNNDADENPYGFTLTGASLATDSEIGVSHNGADLPSNATLDFGSAVTLGGTATQSFTVTNTGAATLAFTSWTVTPASGTSPANTIPPFYLPTIIPTLAPGASATINVVYRPVLVSATDNWVVTMTNSDADEGVYKIKLTGAAVASATPPEVGVSVGGTDIASGGSLAFSTGVNAAITKDILISNTGAEPLLVAAYWTVNSTPAGTTAFTTVQAPPSSIAPGATAVWKVRFLPTTAGSNHVARLTLHNTDPDEGAYVINLTGSTAP